jgi:hypothetical protein
MAGLHWPVRSVCCCRQYHNFPASLRLIAHDDAVAAAGFKHDTGGTLPCIAEPDSLSFLGIDELLDQEAAADSSGHHQHLDALAAGELAAFEMPA